MDKRILLSKVQYLSSIFILVSFLFQVKYLKDNLFTILIIGLIFFLVLTFAHYIRDKKEKGVLVGSIILGLFNILGYGIFGVPENLALNLTTIAVFDALVSLAQFFVVVISFSLLEKKK
ncbi:hypothetical protein CL617_01890 [archaeon]|nr:hypothetical protein [archaeon]|tara:strand:+ start:6648 stop:7004 length:357 start_codon:yes stop_codon:yes gene_type:complete